MVVFQYFPLLLSHYSQFLHTPIILNYSGIIPASLVAKHQEKGRGVS